MVLLADDSAAVRRSLSMALSFCGDCDVTTAASGEEALELLCAGLSPCVVFLDLMMLHGRGQEFRDARQADPRLAEIPIVVLTCAEEGPGIRERLGARAWVVKPPDFDELLGLIAHLCGDDEATGSRSDAPPSQLRPGRQSRAANPAPEDQ